jgi:hypothetical protein
VRRQAWKSCRLAPNGAGGAAPAHPSSPHRAGAVSELPAEPALMHLAAELLLDRALVVNVLVAKAPEFQLGKLLLYGC